jgi:hypothetical protein
MTKETITYAAEDIFKDIEGDEENVLMNIPPEIAEKMGWQPGDVLKIEVLESGGLSISRVENE